MLAQFVHSLRCNSYIYCMHLPYAICINKKKTTVPVKNTMKNYKIFFISNTTSLLGISLESITATDRTDVSLPNCHRGVTPSYILCERQT